MPELKKGIFLSYAREDAQAARKIADTLAAAGILVWFDQSELRGGDVWDARIRRQIQECSLFVPIVSARTQARAEGYFRREWRLAVERTRDMSSNVSFIVPVAIDDLRQAEADVPEEFLRYQWASLPDGVASPQFVEQIKRLLAPRRNGGAEARRSGGRRAGDRCRKTALRRSSKGNGRIRARQGSVSLSPSSYSLPSADFSPCGR